MSELVLSPSSLKISGCDAGHCNSSAGEVEADGSLELIGCLASSAPGELQVQ